MSHIKKIGIPSALCLLSLAFTYVSFPNIYYYNHFFSWICFVPIFVALKSISNIWGKLLISWVFFQSFLLLLFHFKLEKIPVTLNVNEQYDGVLIFSIALPIIWGCSFWIISMLFKNLSSFVRALVQTSIWFFTEYLIIERLIGFPFSLAITNFQNPVIIQVASVGGIGFVSAVIFLSNCSIAQSIPNLNKLTTTSFRLKNFLSIGIFLILMSVIVLWGTYRIKNAL